MLDAGCTEQVHAVDWDLPTGSVGIVLETADQRDQYPEVERIRSLTLGSEPVIMPVRDDVPAKRIS